MKQVTVYTDGACKGNPGPGGWGVVLQCNGTTKTFKGGELETTNNRMELMAAIQALSRLSEDCVVDIFTDSNYLKQGISTWIHNWKQNGWRTSNKKPVKNQDLWQELEQSLATHKVNWHWVKAHNGNEFNELADKLANEGTFDTMKEAST